MLRAVLFICPYPLAPFLSPILTHFLCSASLARLLSFSNTRFYAPLQGHRHLRQGYHANGTIVRGAPFQYGYSYRHIFFTFNETTRRVDRFSREFCIAALDGTKARAVPASLSTPSDACDGISFVMGAFRRNDTPGTLSFTYGVNDCESALLTLSVARLDTLLEFGPD